MEVQQEVLPDGQLQTVAFAVFAQLCRLKADETEMGTAQHTKTKREGNLTLILTMAVERSKQI